MSRSYDRPMTHQEYLKLKYSSQEPYDRKPVKKKFKKVSRAPTVQILDGDIDFKQIKKHDSDEEELYFGTKEEKPQITAIYDDRPLHMRNDSGESKWKAIGSTDTNKNNIENDKSNKDSKSSNSEKTLKGKKAGLSNAKEIKKELAELKRKNAKLLENLTDDISGKNAKTVFRDRKTGKVREIEKEIKEKEEEQAKKDVEETEKKAVYDRWSKGMVQREESIKKIESDLHEMSKPLARYEDDSDLDKLLRDRDREDDPMIKEIRRKREEEHIKNQDVKIFPKYKGPPPAPNRFNISPGYRWDGVDRSNGYESKVFAKVANHEAMQEEAYHWSTQDM